MTFEFGDVVAVSFPFTNQSSAKRRPAVVVSGASYNRVRPDVILAAITSKLDRAATVGDIVVVDWNAAGLRKPSAVKLIVVLLPRTYWSKNSARSSSQTGRI